MKKALMPDLAKPCDLTVGAIERLTISVTRKPVAKRSSAAKATPRQDPCFRCWPSAFKT
jgi:hypothetical protein